jgi:hypothetical protein
MLPEQLSRPRRQRRDGHRPDGVFGDLPIVDEGLVGQ